MEPREIPLLYVDDEEDNLRLFTLQFGEDFSIKTAKSAAEGLSILEKTPVGLVVTDERMPGMSGVDFLAQVAERWPETVRMIISAYSDSKRLLLAINRGHAHEYVLKPWDQEELHGCLERALAMAARRQHLYRRARVADTLAEALKERYDPNRLIGEDGALADLIATARRVARSDATVLIRGESGTGKELLARVIHEASHRAQGPFIKVNCAALSEGVLESELFGHEQGAFTGAHKLRRGRFELARGGTIFLDEIGDISPAVQVRLLRVLQEREFERVGGSTPLPFEGRILAATHQPLEQLVEEGVFRQDLFYRLNVVPLTIPPLRERKEDIEPLLAHFINKYKPSHASPLKLGPGVLEALKSYPWPGNVREMENLVQRAVLLSDGFELTLEDFAFPVSAPRPSLREEIRSEQAKELRMLLVAHNGNVSRAAQKLGIPRTTLLSRAKKLGVL